MGRLHQVLAGFISTYESVVRSCYRFLEISCHNSPPLSARLAVTLRLRVRDDLL